MKTFAKIMLGFILALTVTPAVAALVSRVYIFSDGTILTASQLNTEFNNLVDGVNSISDSNIAAGANISASKLNPLIAGAGIARDSSTGELSISTDNVGVEINSGTLQLKNLGVTTAKLNDDSVTKSKIGSDLTDNSTLEQDGSQTIQIKDLGVSTSKLAAGSVTQVKRAALGQQISSGSGSYSNNTTIFTSVTNLSVTITTTGRPVFIGMTGTSGAVLSRVSSDQQANLRFIRDSTSIYDTLTQVGSPGGTTPCSSFNTIDVPSSGSHTYSVEARRITATAISVTDCILFAYEL